MPICQINVANSEANDLIQKSLERLWHFDDLELCTAKDAEQELCETIFREKHYRDPDGRFVVAIPLKPNITELGSSRQIAMKRFLMLEKRFQRDKVFHEKYINFMREFKELEHITQVKYNEHMNGKMVYYMPRKSSCGA